MGTSRYGHGTTEGPPVVRAVYVCNVNHNVLGVDDWKNYDAICLALWFRKSRRGQTERTCYRYSAILLLLNTIIIEKRKHIRNYRISWLKLIISNTLRIFRNNLLYGLNRIENPTRTPFQITYV